MSNREAQHANVLQSIIQAANRKKRNKDKGGRSAINQLTDGDSSATIKTKLSNPLQKSKGKEMKRNKSAENIVELTETSASSVDNVSETSADTSEVEISFEIVRYPAYHFKDAGAYCVENAKPRSVRRAKSNDSLLTPKMRVANPAYTGSEVSPTVDQQWTDSPNYQMNSSQNKSFTLPYNSTPLTLPYGSTSATPLTLPYGSSSATPPTLPYGSSSATRPTLPHGSSSATPLTLTYGSSSATPPTLPYGSSSATQPTPTYGSSSMTLPYSSSTAGYQYIGAAASSEWDSNVAVNMYSPQQHVNSVSSCEGEH